LSVYLIANLQIEDREQYAAYEAGFMAIFEQYQGRLLAVDEAQQVLEGEWPYTRTVLIAFPDEAAARAWYDSPAYQALAEHRRAASVGHLAMVKGLG